MSHPNLTPSSSAAEHVATVAVDRVEQLDAERLVLLDAVAVVRKKARQAMVAADPESGQIALGEIDRYLMATEQQVAELTSERWRYHGTPDQDAALIATVEGWGGAVTPTTQLAVIAARKRIALREEQAQLTIDITDDGGTGGRAARTLHADAGPGSVPERRSSTPSTETHNG